MQKALKYQQIADSVRQAIKRGDIGRGQILLEGSIAAIFTASRAPVRQALTILESEGLLQRFDGRGLIVGSPRAPRLRKELTPEIFGLDGPVALRKRSWDALYIKVEHDLLMSSFGTPRRINESRLARHYGVSRSLSAQVLARAERSGIIVRDEAGRLLTVTLDARRIDNFFALRRLLEPEALADVARSNRHGEFVAHIEERLIQAQKIRDKLTPERIRALEYDLHVACVDLGSNDVLARAMIETRCALLINIHGWDTLEPFPAFDELIWAHLQIIRALRAKDGALVRTLVVAHIEESRKITLDKLSSLQSISDRILLPYFKDPLAERVIPTLAD